MEFVVQGSVFPAGVENADPFEGQGANGRVVFLPAVALHAVVSGGPSALGDRTASKFMKRLPQKVRTRPTPGDALGFAAPPGDRGDAAVGLHVAGRLDALSVGSESGQQPRSQRITGARQ